MFPLRDLFLSHFCYSIYTLKAFLDLKSSRGENLQGSYVSIPQFSIFCSFLSRLKITQRVLDFLSCENKNHFL